MFVLILKLVGLNSDSRLHLSVLSGLSRSKWWRLERRQCHNYRYHFGFDDVRDSQPDKADHLGKMFDNLDEESGTLRDLLALG